MLNFSFNLISSPLIINMARRITIKLFKITQQICRNIGIFPPESNQNRTLTRFNYWAILLSLVQLFISSAAYLMLEANSLMEYGIVFYSCTTLGFCFFLYLVFIWQVEIISKYIRDFEKFIEKRTN